MAHVTFWMSVLCGCVMLICFGFSSVLIWRGLSGLEQLQEMEKQTTSEHCFLIAYEQKECQYSCGEYDKGTCDGKYYEYTAMAPDKCGNETLYSHESNVAQDDDCENGLSLLKDIEDPFHACKVWDCDDALFTFGEYDVTNHSGYTAEVVIGSIIGGMPVLCCLLILVMAIGERCDDYRRVHRYDVDDSF
eukprot:80747_1